MKCRDGVKVVNVSPPEKERFSQATSEPGLATAAVPNKGASRNALSTERLSARERRFVRRTMKRKEPASDGIAFEERAEAAVEAADAQIQVEMLRVARENDQKQQQLSPHPPAAAAKRKEPPSPGHSLGERVDAAMSTTMTNIQSEVLRFMRESEQKLGAPARISDAVRLSYGALDAAAVPSHFTRGGCVINVDMGFVRNFFAFVLRPL